MMIAEEHGNISEIPVGDSSVCDEDSVAFELANCGEFVVFAGTGVTQGTGVPTWENLLNVLGQVCYGEFARDLSDSDEYPMIAQQIFDDLKKCGREVDYYQTVKEQLTPRDALHSPQQMEIVRVSNKVVTTNFDRTFEDAFEQHKPGIDVYSQSIPNLNVSRLNQACSLTYLHGRSDDCIILKTDDYRMFYPTISNSHESSKNLEEYLKSLYLDHTIVFIGFSFGDSYFKNYLKTIHQECAREDELHRTISRNYVSRLDSIQHFAFLKKFDLEDAKIRLEREYSPASPGYNTGMAVIDEKSKQEMELDNALRALRIRVIRYDEHVDWQKCFRDVREFREKLSRNPSLKGAES